MESKKKLNLHFSLVVHINNQSPCLPAELSSKSGRTLKKKKVTPIKAPIRFAIIWSNILHCLEVFGYSPDICKSVHEA